MINTNERKKMDTKKEIGNWDKQIKILVLTSATDSEEPTVNRLEKVCKKRSIELHRISSDKAYASKKSESKETLIIYN